MQDPAGWCRRCGAPTHSARRRLCGICRQTTPGRLRARRAQKSTAARGYGWHHQQLRRQWAERVAEGTVRCTRCRERIIPGSAWDLGHDDHDRDRYTGPEHASCNRAAGGRSRHHMPARLPTGSPSGRAQSRVW